MKAKRFIPYIVLFSALFILAGCGQLGVGIETPVEPAGQPTEQVQPTQPVEATEPATPEPTPTSQPSPYWRVVEDPQYGVRYAVPCFWQVNFPPDYGPGAGAQSYAITNYPYDFVLSFPRGQGIFEAGGIKIDMNFMNVADWGIAPGASLIEFIQTLYPAGGETQVTGMEEMVINNQPALKVATEGTFGPGGFYLLAVNETTYLLFAPIPEAAENPDVLAILNSIAIASDTAAQTPTFQPGPPPTGLTASCLENPGEPNTFSETPPKVDCQVVTPDQPGWTACNVQLGINSRNLSALLGYMTNPFHIGYWGSEGRTDTPEAIIEEMQSTRLPSDPSLAVTFTSDRDQFPPLGGQNPEALFGPDVQPVEILYSEGWGPDREGAALLYFVENADGKIEWYGMIYSDAKFDKPVQANTLCGASSFSSLEELTQAIQQGLQQQDIGTLQYGNIIHDPILLVYWQSEGETLTSAELASTLANQLLPIDPGGLTFTTTPEDFPPLGGMPRNTLLGPDVPVARVIYSEGWGEDGKGAALIYLTQDECQGYTWYGLVFSPQHFDK